MARLKQAYYGGCFVASCTHLQLKKVDPFITKRAHQISVTWAHQGSKLTFWGSGPPDGSPALRIWWSGLKSGGPENYILHFHLKHVHNMYSEAQLFNTLSFGTDSLPSEYWITEDDSVWWWCEVMRFRRHGLRSRMAYALRLLFPSNHGKVLSNFLYGLLQQSYSACHRLQSFSFWLVDAFDKWPHATSSHFHYHGDRWTGSEQHDPQMNDAMRDVSGDI